MVPGLGCLYIWDLGVSFKTVMTSVTTLYQDPKNLLFRSPLCSAQLTYILWSLSPFRSTHEVVTIDNFLYALGGNDGSASLNSMEKFDSKLNKWIMVTSMSARRSSVGMISHKKSLITIFGHKHFRQKFHQKFDIFHEKISTASDFGSNFKFWSKIG